MVNNRNITIITYKKQNHEMVYTGSLMFMMMLKYDYSKDSPGNTLYNHKFPLAWLHDRYF